MDWLEKAQELAPDIVDINFIEALVYVYGGRYQDARIVLDYLREAAFENYYLYRAEMAFWRRQGKLEEALEWSEKAMQAADTVPQRLRVKSRMGEMYLESGDEDKALETYREAIHFDPKNAELHHKASLIYWQRENYEEANRFNRKALSLQPDFPEAQQLRALLDEHVQSSGLMGRLFGS
jgi:tetratricopeptide (TPR) repeat protein